MAIYKSMDHGKTWQPFQYYSADCKAVFDRDQQVHITRANEQEPLCLDSHLQEDGSTRIAFSTLAERPSAEDFENSPVLQDWVTATDIRIVFPAVAKVEKSKKEIKIDLSAQPRLDLIRSEKLVSSNGSRESNFFDDDFGSGFGALIDDLEEDGDDDEQDDFLGMSNEFVERSDP